MKRILLSKNLAIVVVIIGLTGCDVFQKDPDVSPTQTIDMYVVANKAAVIDLKHAFPNFGKINLQGARTNVKYFGDRYIKYQSLSGNTDEFNFSLTTTTSQNLNAAVSVHTQPDNDCGEPFTYAKIKKDSKLVVNLFNNPEFCNYDIYSVGGMMISDPRTSDVQKNVEGILLSACGCGTEGHTAILSYDPPKGFVGQVVGKYYLGIPIDPQASDWQDDPYNPVFYRFYSTHEFTIDVVDDIK